MDTKLVATSRLERFEADEWNRIITSPLWAIYEARLQSVLDQSQRTLADSDNDIELRRAQGALAALRTVLTIPGGMLHEMRTPKVRKA